MITSGLCFSLPSDASSTNYPQKTMTLTHHELVQAFNGYWWQDFRKTLGTRLAHNSISLGAFFILSQNIPNLRFATSNPLKILYFTPVLYELVSTFFLFHHLSASISAELPEIVTLPEDHERNRALSASFVVDQLVRHHYNGSGYKNTFAWALGSIIKLLSWVTIHPVAAPIVVIFDRYLSSIPLQNTTPPLEQRPFALSASNRTSELPTPWECIPINKTALPN